MIYQIPLGPLPNQEFQVILNGQQCTIHLYQRGEKMYCDLYVGADLIAAGCMCHDKQNIIRQACDFSGLLFFYDTQGENDPQWEETGSRYLLMYAESEADLS